MSAAEDHARWREQRRSAVTAPTGNLALIETRWTGEVPDIEAAKRSAPSSATVTPLQRTGIDSGLPEHGLRVWDAQSPAINSFEKIDAYDYDPSWVITAQFIPVGEGRTVPFEHIRDNGGTRNLVVPGDIVFTLDGNDYSLSAFDDGGQLLLVFADQTNGSETYGSGRFLFVDRSAEDSENVTLDFNRAFVPPCGFSAKYNCPLPPATNRFSLPIRAGEKNVVFRDDFDIYAA
ncbi:hypothetical protein FHX48_002723 [Microbacterium halimionae]|uniref:DUF1684 domain-containing protein n=1 Tax=Microbacterium halimionae TaxID=1526413 RepID=A0A7W3PMW3_9MICO|nr:DUF1684 domain-containing protein [Microbacterium halimionae]MBA8817618.1 hypothetical protein [Microbacterium halimionae]NII94328.1 hypothetical protein [Microbacterium halimionae]